MANFFQDMFRCEACNKSFQQPVYRYTLSIKLSDHTGSLWISAFDRCAQTIVGKIIMIYYVV